MSTPALDKLLAQGRYSLEIVGFDARTSLGGDDLSHVAKTELKLSVKSSNQFPGTSNQRLRVRIVGPTAKFDQAADGQIIVGAFRIANGEYELVILGTEHFLSQCMAVLTALPHARCSLAISTQTKVEQSAEEYVFVLEATVSCQRGDA